MSFGTSRTWIIRHYLDSSDDVDDLRANVELQRRHYVRTGSRF